MGRNATTLFRPGVLGCFALGFLASVLSSAAASAAPAQPPTPLVSLVSKAATEEVIGAPVILDGVELFRVGGISTLPPEKRAELIASRIRQLAADRALSPKALRVIEVEEGSRIAADDRLVMVVTHLEAQLEGANPRLLAGQYIRRIGEAIEAYRHDRTAAYLLRSGSFALASTIALALFLWLGGRAMRRLDAAFEHKVGGKLRQVEARSMRTLSAANLWRALHGVRRLLWWVAGLAAIVVYLQFLLHLFPWTRWLGRRLLPLLVDPLRAAGEGLLAAIPGLLFLVILVVVTRFVLKTTHLLFTGLAQGTVSLEGFEREWAWPTDRVVRLLIVIFAFVVAYPFIPGSESDAFRGISVFIGVMFSLGSTSLIGNIIAGYAMIYRRAFHVGDRVLINEHFGDVVELRLLATRVRTPKNEEIIIPNSAILNSSVVNYSTLAREGRLILHTIVRIGYQVPWRQVEAMLLQAAGRSEGLLTDPKPFVLQKGLGDFAVDYEINTYCDDAQAMNRLYTRLHQNILDVFNEYGVQIMTPAYEGDPEQAKIVPKDQWYAPPATAPDRAPG